MHCALIDIDFTYSTEFEGIVYLPCYIHLIHSVLPQLMLLLQSVLQLFQLAPIDAPNDLDIINTTNTTVTFKWGSVHEEVQILGYHYKLSFEDDIVQSGFLAGENSTIVTLKVPGRCKHEYSFMVTAANEGGNGPPIKIERLGLILPCK